jgi:hypothetical protein
MNEQVQQTQTTEEVKPVQTVELTGITSLTDEQVDALTVDTITREMMDVMTPPQIEKFKAKLSEIDMKVLMQKFSGSSVPAEEHPIEPTPPAATVTGFNIPNINYAGGSEPSQEDPSNMTASEEPTEQKGAIIFED